MPTIVDVDLDIIKPLINLDTKRLNEVYNWLMGFSETTFKVIGTNSDAMKAFHKELHRKTYVK